MKRPGQKYDRSVLCEGMTGLNIGFIYYWGA
jgi:hypothetical protein